MIVLDTHAWIWLSNESREFSKSVQNAIRKSDILGVSAISCWETAMLVAKQRLGLAMDVQDWIDVALESPKIRLVPIDPRIAVMAARLPGVLHGDPADRIIAATCLIHRAPLITKDQKLHEWGHIKTIW